MSRVVRHVHTITADGRPRWEECVGVVSGRTRAELLVRFERLLGVLSPLGRSRWLSWRMVPEAMCAGPYVARDERTGALTTLDEAARR